MGARINYEKGHKFEGTRLTFICEVDPYVSPKGKKYRKAKFQCECGTVFNTVLIGVRKKKVHSCGCYLKNRMEELFTTHGGSKSYLYNTWCGLMSRTQDPNHENYSYYGGRGIDVCEQWSGDNGFENFREDITNLLGERPHGYTLDRVDVNGHYTPENCRWADKRHQGYNQRKRSTNTSGRTGVRRHRDKWGAHITVEGKTLYLGVYEDYSDAVKAREEAEIHYYGYTKE